MRSRTRTARDSPESPSGSTATAAAPGTDRIEGASPCQGVTQATVCRPSALGPRATRSAATAMSLCQPRPAVRTAANSRERSASARSSSARRPPIRVATSIAAVSWAGVGPGSASSSQTYPRTTPRWRTGRQRRSRNTPASGAAGMRTGPVARVMPKPSNQARTAGVDFRVRIDRVRTGSIAVSSSLSWAPKAISPKSRFSSVAGAPSSAEISSTSSW
ncbi:hypothetical protein STANM309S_00338 [Streptomyces tanashiensis]